MLCLLNTSVPAGHNPLRQTKENTGQNHQPEEIQTLTMQLRHIGDSVNHRMIQEVRTSRDLPWGGKKRENNGCQVAWVLGAHE